MQYDRRAGGLRRKGGLDKNGRRGRRLSLLSQGSGKAGGVQKRETEGGKREKAAVSG